MLIYIIDEKKKLDSDSIRNNEKLKALIKLRLTYKIPLLILLTNSDNYCDVVKKSEKDWKKTCKDAFNQNKNYLLEYINEQIKKESSDFIMNEKDIMHIVLVETNQNQMDDEEITKMFSSESRQAYEKADENGKKVLLGFFRNGMESKENEVRDFIEKEVGVLGLKELIEKIKENLPSQFHNALNQII